MRQRIKTAISATKGFIIITGGAGFIGSSLIRLCSSLNSYKILNIDNLTYAVNKSNLIDLNNIKDHELIKADISNYNKIKTIFEKFKPDFLINLAAETHVDNSINSSNKFIKTNIIGTHSLLLAAYDYWSKLSPKRKNNFKFLHVSTDEVYGDLGKNKKKFKESFKYHPSSPYSASKASSDHLVRAWHRTYGLPILITNCSNNYGPYQNSEKLIPMTIKNALSLNKIPIYGNGKQIRDWLFVDDHTKALLTVLKKGKIGETYNIGGNNEKTNIFIVESICKILDKYPKENKSIKYSKLISFVKDRPGHDIKYAVNSSKIQKKLNWRPQESFNSGLNKTVDWYYNYYTSKKL